MLLVLDACTIINILKINEDNFLLDKLRKLDMKICQMVYAEVRENLRQKYPTEDYDSQLGELFRYTNVYNDFIQNSEDEVNRCYEDVFLKCHSYKKRNGEFFSVLCCSVLSRDRKSKVHFYTDDYKAKEDFSGYFSDHQIGYIEDTVDLLIFLSANDSTFKKVDLLRFIDNLRSRYESDHSELYKKLNEHYQSFSIRDGRVKHLVFSLIGALKVYNITEANNLKQKISNKENHIIYKLLLHYDSVFQTKSEYVNKLKYLLSHFARHSLFSIE